MTLPDTTAARAEILQRVRTALSAKGTHHSREDSPESEPSGIRPVPSRDELLDLFVERVEDYRAVVVRCSEAEVPGQIAQALQGSESVVMPTGFADAWVLGVPARWTDEADIDDVREIEGIHAVVTTATVAIAETGTIVLDHGPGQGRRGLSLLPDLHVCVVRAEQVVTTVPEAVSALRPSVAANRPLTWISGPSATSDIELDRVEGVHGPRTLHVILVDGAGERAGLSG